MNATTKLHGKIALGMRGSGTVTEEMIEKRARELAVINGRDQFNDDDIREARHEMLGFEEGDAEETDTGMTGSGSTGRRAATMSPMEPQEELEGMVQGGVDEAEHDTMLKGARSPENQE